MFSRDILSHKILSMPTLVGRIKAQNLVFGSSQRRENALTRYCLSRPWPTIRRQQNPPDSGLRKRRDKHSHKILATPTLVGNRQEKRYNGLISYIRIDIKKRAVNLSKNKSTALLILPAILFICLIHLCLHSFNLVNTCLCNLCNHGYIQACF